MPESDEVTFLRSLVTAQVENLAAGQRKLGDDLTALKIEVSSFKPVKLVVFSFVAMVLMAVVGALIALVVMKH